MIKTIIPLTITVLVYAILSNINIASAKNAANTSIPSSFHHTNKVNKVSNFSHIRIDPLTKDIALKSTHPADPAFIPFKPNEIIIRKIDKLDNNLIYLVIFCTVFLAPTILFFIVYYKISKIEHFGKDNLRATIQYEPPKDTSFLENYLIYFKELNSLALAAQLIDLAIRGYVQIIDLNTAQNSKLGFEIIKTEKTANLSNEEIKLMKIYFGETQDVEARVQLAKLKYKLHKKAKHLFESVSLQVTEKGYFINNPILAIRKMSKIGVFFMFAGITLLFFGVYFFLVGLSLVMCGALIYIFSTKYAILTQKGIYLNNYIYGLKLYLVMTEQERFQFHQLPENTKDEQLNLQDSTLKIKLFESLLPYSLIFGIENNWVQQFKNIYKEPPVWYSNSSNTYNADYFIKSLFYFTKAIEISQTSPYSVNDYGGIY